jgi:hypothetical protein
MQIVRCGLDLESALERIAPRRGDVGSYDVGGAKNLVFR